MLTLILAVILASGGHYTPPGSNPYHLRTTGPVAWPYGSNPAQPSHGSPARPQPE